MKAVKIIVIQYYDTDAYLGHLRQKIYVSVNTAILRNTRFYQMVDLITPITRIQLTMLL